MWELLTALYTSEKYGDDENGDGSEEKPLKTILKAMKVAGSEPFPTIYVDGKEGVKFEPAAKSQLKKIHKIWTRDSYKQADKAKKEEEDSEKRAKNLEEARKIVITEDATLPKATLIRIFEGICFSNE